MKNGIELKKLIIKLVIFIAVIGAIAGGVYGIMCALGVNTIEGLQSICNGNPWLSYSIIILLQVIQVVFIPISNQLITIPAIAVLGIWPAFFCSWIGIEIGTVILYLIGRFGGGKFLKWLLSDKEKADKFSNLLKSRKLFYPVGMIIGVIPDDLLTTLAGCAKYNFLYVLSVSIITRGICTATTVFSFGFLTKTWWGILILVVLIILLCAIGYIFLRYEPRIEAWWQKRKKTNDKPTQEKISFHGVNCRHTPIPYSEDNTCPVCGKEMPETYLSRQYCDECKKLITEEDNRTVDEILKENENE